MIAILNAVGLAFAIWRDRRELRFVEAIMAGRSRDLHKKKCAAQRRPKAGPPNSCHTPVPQPRG